MERAEDSNYAIDPEIRVYQFMADDLASAEKIAIDSFGMETYLAGGSMSDYYINDNGIESWKLYELSGQIYDFMPRLETAKVYHEHNKKQAELETDLRVFEQLKKKLGK